VGPAARPISTPSVAGTKPLAVEARPDSGRFNRSFAWNQANSTAMTQTHSKPPRGKVTFLFTDIVGSTKMWERLGDSFLPILQAHNAILTDAVARFGGYIVKTEGDCYKIAFADPVAAAKCAVVAQAALHRYPWPADAGQLSVRMAVHSGDPFMQGGDYFGPPVNRTARMLSAAHGGQVLISE